MDLVDDAYVKLKIIFRHYKKNRKSDMMVMLLCGYGNFSVKDDYNSPHNYQAVLFAIHRYYSEIKDNDLVLLFNDALKKAVSSVSSKYTIQETIDLFDFELFLERYEDSSFNADIRGALTEFNKSLCKVSKDLQEIDDTFNSWLINKRKYFCASNVGYPF